MAKTKKRGPTPPRAVRTATRGRPGQILPTANRRKLNRRRNIVTGIIVFALLGGAVTGAVIAVQKDNEQRNNPTLEGLSRGPIPWQPEYANLAERVRALDLPSSANVFHIHSHLDVFVDGVKAEVPANIGLAQTGVSTASPGATVIAAIHTHDATGVIHIEGATTFDPTLRDVFGVWGVRFTKTCLGVYCATADSPLDVYVNGKKLTSDPTGYVMKAHDEIAVVFGEPPKSIPKTYKFPKGD